MRGNRSQKHPSLLTGHRPPRELTTVTPTRLRVPTAPIGLLPLTRRRWRELWLSQLAGIWDRQTDLSGITRYILELDKWFRYEVLVQKMPLVKGSKGQLRANPLAARMDAIAQHLRSLEEQYGLTPLSRLRLGIQFTTGRLSMDELLSDLSRSDYGGGRSVVLVGPDGQAEEAPWEQL